MFFSNYPIKPLPLGSATFQLIKHKARQAIQTTRTDMFICTPLLTLKQFPQQHEVAKNNVFRYGWG